MPGALLLAAKGITKRFGGVQALADVGFTINHGEIYGLIGPNGAGKTTLFNVLTGIYVPDGGEFTFDGAPLCGSQAERRRRARHRAHVPEHPPVRQPVGARERDDRPPRAHARRRVGRDLRATRRRAPRRSAIEKRAYELLDYVGVAKRANSLAKHLAYGDQRRLEIARALATEPKLLALDEPAAGMNATETASLKRLLDEIRRDGTTILLIEHDMKLVMSVCDRVLVLDYGKKIAEGPGGGSAERSEGDRGVSRRRGVAEPRRAQPDGGRRNARTPLLALATSSRSPTAASRRSRASTSHVEQGRARLPDRRQRRGQDDDAQGHLRPAAGQGGHDPLRRQGRHRHARVRARARGPRDGARGPRRVRRADHRGEPRDGRVHPHRSRRHQGGHRARVRRCFRGSRSAGGRPRGRCPAASSRCSRWAAR